MLRLVSYAYMPSPLPRRSDEACSLVYLHRQRPSLCNSQVGSCNCFFGACSAFTHVMAYTLAESPCDTLYIESSDSFVASAAASIATGWSEPVPGQELHPLKPSAYHGALFRQRKKLRHPGRTSYRLKRDRRMLAMFTSRQPAISYFVTSTGMVCDTIAYTLSRSRSVSGSNTKERPSGGRLMDRTVRSGPSPVIKM